MFVDVRVHLSPKLRQLSLMSSSAMGFGGAAPIHGCVPIIRGTT
jgi:hypothetical protein